MSTQRTIINAWCNADFRRRYLNYHPSDEVSVQRLAVLHAQDTQLQMAALFAPLTALTGDDYTQYTKEDLAND